MKKWFIIGSLTAGVVLAVSVYAYQGGISIRNDSARSWAKERGTGCPGCVSPSGCGLIPGGCGTAASSPEQVQARLEMIRTYFVDYYTGKKGLAGITVEVESFGCHEEATIKQNGETIARFSISGKNISPLDG